MSITSPSLTFLYQEIDQWDENQGGKTCKPRYIFPFLNCEIEGKFIVISSKENWSHYLVPHYRIETNSLQATEITFLSSQWASQLDYGGGLLGTHVFEHLQLLNPWLKGPHRASWISVHGSDPPWMLMSHSTHCIKFHHQINYLAQVSIDLSMVQRLTHG